LRFNITLENGVCKGFCDELPTAVTNGQNGDEKINGRDEMQPEARIF